MMKRFLFLAVTAVCMVSCFGDTFYEATDSPLDTFEFLRADITMDKNGDSLFFGPSFSSSYFIYLNADKDTEPGEEVKDGLKGGFGMSARQLRWPLDGTAIEPGDKPNDNLFMTMFQELKGKKPAQNSYAVFYDAPSDMPEHDIMFGSRDVGTWTPNFVSIANTAYTVARAKGLDISGYPGQYPEYVFKKFSPAEGEEPAVAGDYITVVVKGYRDGAAEPVGKAEISLVDFRENSKYPGQCRDSVMTEWRRLDLTKLGDVDYLDFDIESSVEDFPVYFCLDSLYSGVHIKY